MPDVLSAIGHWQTIVAASKADKHQKRIRSCLSWGAARANLEPVIWLDERLLGCLTQHDTSPPPRSKTKKRIRQDVW